MDLVDLWLLERLAIAEQAENGELSASESARRVDALNRRIQTEIERRQKSIK